MYCGKSGRIPLLLLVLVLYSILLIVLLRVIRFPPTCREDMFVAFIPATHNHLACYMRQRLRIHNKQLYVCKTMGLGLRGDDEDEP